MDRLSRIPSRSWRVALHSAEFCFPGSGSVSREFRTAGRSADVFRGVTSPRLPDAVVYGCVDWFMYPTPSTEAATSTEGPAPTPACWPGVRFRYARS